MRNSSLWILLLIALASISVIGIWASCGDDDDDDDDATEADDDDVETGDKGKLGGCVHDFQTKQPVQGALIKVLDNDTGDPIDFEATSPGGDGCVTFDGLPTDPESFGIIVSRDGHMDTMQFNFPNGITGEEFLIVSDVTASLVAGTVGMEIDETAGMAAGGDYWGKSDGTVEWPVGCASVEFEPANPGKVFYFGVDGLPTPNRAITGDVPEDGQGTNPCCGPNSDDHFSFYVSVNHPVTAGGVEMTATAYSDDGNQVETGYLPLLIPNTVAIANIVYEDTEYETNPTPTWCTE